MARFRKASADEARSRAGGQVRKAVGGDAVIKGFRSPPSWDPTKRTAKFVMSSETVDRYGDIVIQGGLDTTRFMDNPVGLLFHNSKSWPCGQWSDLVKVLNGRPKRTEGLLTLLPAGADVDVDRAANHVAAGTIRTTSIGFIPDYDQVELILDDDEEWVTGLQFNVSELIECSLVPIPANPDALVKNAGGELQLARDIVEEMLDNYARSPEGVLMPRSIFEKQYKVIVEKIAADEIAPAAKDEPGALLTDEAVAEVAKILVVGDVVSSARADDGKSVKFFTQRDGEPFELAQVEHNAEILLEAIAVAVRALQDAVPDAPPKPAEDDKSDTKAIDAFLAALKAGDKVTVRRGYVETTTVEAYRNFAKSEKGGIVTITRGEGELLVSIEELPDDFDERVTKHLTGLAPAVEETAETTDTTTITLNIDTTEAVAKVGAFAKMLEGVQAQIAKLFSVKEAPAAETVERTEPIVDTKPSAEQVAEARAAASAVLADLQSKGRIAA